MTHAQLIPVLLVLAAIAMAVIIAVGRSILREMNGGLGDEDESQAARRNTEERKNERIARELQGRRMSDEQMMDAKRQQWGEHWQGKGEGQ